MLSVKHVPIVLLAAMSLWAVPAAAATRLVSLTFVNYTSDVRPVTIVGPQGSTYIGAFSRGGVLNVTIPVFDTDTPVTVGWIAGNRQGEFTIDGNTPGYLRIDLTRRGTVGPYSSAVPAAAR